MIRTMNEKMEVNNISDLEKRLAVELEERLELGCWSTNCGVCNDYVINSVK